MSYQNMFLPILLSLSSLFIAYQFFTRNKERKEKKEKKEGKPQTYFAPIVPKDKEGFVKSFQVKEEKEIREFFEEYGFVVIDNVITEEEREDALNEIWETIEKERDNVKRDNPETWEPFASGAQLGFLGSGLSIGKAAWNVRQSKEIFQAFQIILKTSEVLVSVDRYGIMRPTKNVKLLNGKTKDFPHWKSQSNWFHFDLNPWTYFTQPKYTEEEEIERSKGRDGSFLWDRGLFIVEGNDRPMCYYEGSEKVQGVVSFLESREDDGGFICVPGFHKFIQEWNQKYPPRRGDFIGISKIDAADIDSNAQKISMRKGSICIWSSLLPHCNFPNDSSRFRACMYLKMFPRTILPELDGYFQSRTKAIQTLFPPGFEVSEIGQKVFGLDG